MKLFGGVKKMTILKVKRYDLRSFSTKIALRVLLKSDNEDYKNALKQKLFMKDAQFCVKPLPTTV